MRKEEIVKKVTEHTVLIKAVREDVKQIRSNELPHLRKRLDWIIGLIITSLVSLAFLLANL